MDIPQDIPVFEPLPKPPGLYNPSSRNGPVVRFQALAFGMPMETLEKWADDNQVAIDKRPHTKRDIAWKVLFGKLRHLRCKASIVPVRGVGVCRAVVVAHNQTPEDLKMGEDLEMIRAVQNILGTTKAPIWYIPSHF
ncbi:hypothetical protein BYT27DRAFT_7190271, partial [Phlegmacium glaucopus]